MDILIVNHSQVHELIPMNECIEVMATALRAAAEGRYGTPPRNVVWLPGRKGALGMMPSYATDLKTMGLKVVSVFPGNAGTEYDSHQGAIMLFETDHGRPLAIVDAGAITAIRTPAVSALATKLLAREDASELALLGSGIQAYGHLEALLHVRPIRRATVWSMPSEHARRFAVAAAERFHIPVEAVATSREAAERADIICTLTPSHEPVLRGADIRAGTHINAVGACIPVARELDTEAVVKSRLFVDRRESTMCEAGDFLIPRDEGAIGDDHIVGEIGDLLTGKIEGRQSAEQITLFKSLGLALEDIASAIHVFDRAVERKIGLVASLGEKRKWG